eukprot:6197657-Pleurochrysis_carterae.AAC.4
MGTCCAKPSKAERDDTRIQIPSVVSRQASSNGENTPATCKAYPSVASPASGPSPQIKLDGKAPKGTAAAAKSKGRSSSMRPRPYVPLPERYPMAAKNPSTKSMAVLTHFSAFDNYADSVRVSADRFLTALIKEDRVRNCGPFRLVATCGSVQLLMLYRTISDCVPRVPFCDGSHSHASDTSVIQLSTSIYAAHCLTTNA